jgi:hypothetical protein
MIIDVTHMAIAVSLNLRFMVCSPVVLDTAWGANCKAYAIFVRTMDSASKRI